MNLREVYEPIPNLLQKTAGTKLRPFEWEVLGQVDGKKTAAEIGVHLSLSEAVLEATFARLLEKSLVQVTELTWEEFIQRYSEETPVLESDPSLSIPIPPLPAGPPPSEEVAVEFTLRKPSPLLPNPNEKIVPTSSRPVSPA